MKKNLFIPALLLCCSIAQAQTEKGDKTLGLNLGFNITTINTINVNPGASGYLSTEHEHTIDYGFSPTYSHFIADKLDISWLLGYSGATTTSEYRYSGSSTGPDKGKTISNSFVGGVALRKYFLYDNMIGIRTGPFFYYSNGKADYNSSNSYYSYMNAKMVNYQAGLNLDLVYYPSKHIGVASNLGSLSYYYVKTDNTYPDGTLNHTDTQQFTLDLISRLQLSVFYVFGK